MKVRGWQLNGVLCILTGMLLLGKADVTAAGTVNVMVDRTALDVGDALQVTVQTSEPSDDAVPPEITLTYNADLLEFTYCSTEYGGGEGGLITLRGTGANLAFKAKKAGSASLRAEAVIDEDGNQKATASKSVSIAGDGNADTTQTDTANDMPDETDSEGQTQEQQEAEGQQNGETEGSLTVADVQQSAVQLSSNAYLKKFKVTDAKLKPKFSKEVTDYTVTLKSDVSQLVFTAKTDDQNAEIVATSGFANLKNGSNKAVLTVKAQDGTTMSYTFTIIKEGAAASETDTQEREKAEVQDGLIPIKDSDLYVNTSFPDEFLPEGFIKADYVYKEQYVEAAHFEMGDLMLLYLSAFDGSEADFYIYYSGMDEFMDFIQLKGAEGHFICPVQLPVGIVIPDGFQDATMVWNDKTVTAFMAAQSEDNDADGSDAETAADGDAADQEDTTDDRAEGATDDTQAAADGDGEETTEENIAADPYDFYLIYAMNQDGGEGFYLYDSREGTYQRFLQLASDSDSDVFDEENYVIYKTKSQRRMTIIAFLIVVVVLLLFVILNLILKLREQGGTDTDDEDEVDPDGRAAGEGGASRSQEQKVRQEEKQAQREKRRQAKEKEKQDRARAKEQRQQELQKQRQERVDAEEEKRRQEQLLKEQREKEKALAQQENEQRQQERKAEEQRQQERKAEEQRQREQKAEEQKRRQEEEKELQKQASKEEAAKKRRTQREKQREEALRRIDRRAEQAREAREATRDEKGAAVRNRPQGPIMFDLTTPKIDDNLTPKMQREQVDDDFEFEFINIDED